MNIISFIIFGFITGNFLKILGETIITFLRIVRAKTPVELKRWKRLFLIRGGFLLPWELTNLSVTFLFAFVIFHRFTSSILIIALTSLLFKEIFSEIPYLFLCAFYYFFKTPLHLKEDPFIQETEIIPMNFFSCIYIPQKAKSMTDVYAGITQGIRALKNNCKPQSHLVFIYHSDTEEDNLIEEELRLIIEAKKELGERIFFFSRNREAFNPFFLRKPGGYMSDYQILNKGVWHPLNYISHNFDARRQKIVSPEGIIREHFPFSPLEIKNENQYQYFIHYQKKLFLKEKFNLRKTNPSAELFEDIKFYSQSYLVNKEEPEEYYLLCGGTIFSSQGKPLLKPSEWKIDSEGNIEVMGLKNELFKNKQYEFVFVQTVYLNGRKKLFLDPAANLIDIDRGEIWASYGKYRLELSYDLYRLRNRKFFLLKKDFLIKENLRERDYRRLLFDRMTKISWESLKKLVEEKIISFSQAEEFMQRGIVGNTYHLHIGKKGIEKEYFIEDQLIKFKTRVFGGYLVRENSGFSLDKEGNLIFENKLIESKENLIETFVKNEDGIDYLMYKEKQEEFFVRYTETNEKIRVNPKERYFYVLNPWINKIKILDSGFVVNEKDGFYLDREGNLWYVGGEFDPEKKLLLVAKKEKIKELLKENISVDYKDNLLKKSFLLAEAGGWYRDRESKIRIRKIISLRDFVYFDEKLDALVVNPLSGKFTLYPHGSYTLGEVYLWQRISEDDPMITEENISVKDGNLLKEEVIAKEGEYYFSPEGEVILRNGERLPYGIYLRTKDGKWLKDKDGRFIPGDCRIKIVNQTDADGEFQPKTIPYLNSKLICNLKAEEPFLMLQPEISFGNQGETKFSRFHYWAQQMYRFTGRAIFSLYGESSAYGKMTKWLDAYVKNILFKEAIPPLARTHDHWEAMHLKTALVFSYPHLKSKNLIENTPPNYFSFLKRLEGWLGGDLLLLEYETYLGVFMDSLRIIFSFLKMDISESRFWIGHLHKRINYLWEKSDNPSYLSKKLRIWLIKRLAFSPLYYGLWLILVGTFSLVIPGTLTIKSPHLAWCIFWAVLAILILLPKIIVPILERLLLFEKRKTKFFIFITMVFLAFFINKLGNEILPEQWSKISVLLLSIFFFYRLIIHSLEIISALKLRIIRYAGNITLAAILGFSLWLYAPFLLNWLEKVPSAKWLFSFLLQFIPSLAGFLFPFFLLLEIIPQQRITLEIIKRGVWETIYSSSILLLNIIHIPLIVLFRMGFILSHPYKTIPWITSPFIEKVIGKRMSLFDTYLRIMGA
ncbi:MAG: hypothetical protein NC898_04395, partial [Candidatus Omnitrophica bacterium]|nr:hypothetical protein [Candidatus Omnitrophota bacterium]